MTDDDRMLYEGREAGKRYVASFNGDWAALLADLNRRSIEQGRTFYEPSQPIPEPAKPADRRTAG